jgi:hypothetical protein
VYLFGAGTSWATIGTTPQTISVVSAPTMLPFAQTQYVSAVASSGLTITFASLTPSVCYIANSNVVATLSYGTCTIQFSQAGNATYAPATATVSFPVVSSGELLSQTISFSLNFSNGDLPVGAGGTVTATASSGSPVTLTSMTPSICMLSGNVVTGVSAGTCDIRASQAGDTYHYPEQTDVTFNVQSTNAIVPQTGFWWNPAESGRGFVIEIQGSTMFMAGFLYTASGEATWVASTGPMTSPTQYSGSLVTYTGGQTLNGAYQAPSLAPPLGTISITFSADNQATLTWPGGTIPIQRFNFV